MTFAFRPIALERGIFTTFLEKCLGLPFSLAYECGGNRTSLPMASPTLFSNPYPSRPFLWSGALRLRLPLAEAVPQTFSSSSSCVYFPVCGSCAPATLKAPRNGLLRGSGGYLHPILFAHGSLHPILFNSECFRPLSRLRFARALRLALASLLGFSLSPPSFCCFLRLAFPGLPLCLRYLLTARLLELGLRLQD